MRDEFPQPCPAASSSPPSSLPLQNPAHTNTQGSPHLIKPQTSIQRKQSGVTICAGVAAGNRGGEGGRDVQPDCTFRNIQSKCTWVKKASWQASLTAGSALGEYLHDFCTIWTNHMHANDFVGLGIHQNLHEASSLIARDGVLHGPACQDSTASNQQV